MRPPITLLLSVLLPVALLTPGCSGSGQADAPTAAQRQPAPSASSSDTQSLTARPDQSISRSALREQAVASLIQHAQHERPEIRANAIEGLKRSPGRLEPVAAAGLRDSNQGVRAVAAMAAGEAGLSRLVPSIRGLQSDPSPYARISAIYGLHALGDRPDVTPLSQYLLNDPSMHVRSHTAYVLGEMGEPSAIKLLTDGAKLRGQRYGESERNLFRLQVAEAMVKLGDEEQIDVIRASLFPARPEELEATAAAAQILGELEDRQSINPLISLVDDSRPANERMPVEVRLAAARTLTQLGQRGGVAVADEYLQDASPVVRSQAAFVYAADGSSTSLRRLATLMDDPSPQVRVAAAAGVLEATDSRSRRRTSR